MQIPVLYPHISFCSLIFVGSHGCVVKCVTRMTYLGESGMFGKLDVEVVVVAVLEVEEEEED